MMRRSETTFTEKPQLLPALGCALAVLVAVAVVHPAGEIPMGDEITYAHTAQTLARTGHVTYIGFINAIGGWQLYWGAAAIRFFGSSYLVLRWSMAVVAMAVAFLLHRCMERAGVRPMLAVAGTLTFCLSPLFLSKATTFLTDVPGVLAVVVCLYGCLRALVAGSVRSTIFWLGVATIGNSILGSSRQIPWLGVIVMVPSALWLLRGRRVVVAGAGLCVVSLGMDGAMQLWFMQQPYTTREPSLLLGLSPHRMQMMCLFGLGALLETGLLLLPISLGLLPVLRRRWPGMTYGAAALFVAGALGLWRIHALYALGVPYLGPSFRWPLGEDGKIVLTAAIVLGLLALLTTVLTRGDTAPMTAGERRISERSLTVLLLPFLLAYLVALLPRAYNGGLWDRYILLLAVVLLVWLLRLSQDRIRRPVVVLALALCGGAYATALMHDNFACERARLGALGELAARGVPRTAVTGGWPYDIETELQVRPFVTPAGVRLPKGVALPAATNYGLANCEGFQCDLVSDVVPKYGVSTEAERGLPGFVAVPYRGWVTPNGVFVVTWFP